MPALTREKSQLYKTSRPLKNPLKNTSAFYIADRHLAEFKASAIPRDWAKLNFRTLDNLQEIAEFLGWKKYTHASGWMATGLDPLTGASSGFGQFKPDEILIFPNGVDDSPS